MKHALRHYLPVAGLLAGIVAASLLLTCLTGSVGVFAERPKAVATVYPLYVAARQVVGDTDAVEVEHFTGTASGCLHDYQISPADRVLLERAALLVCNGAGAEAFLGDLPLPPHTVDTSAGVELLHKEDTHGHEGHDHEGHTANEHLWTSPRRYAQQVEQVVAALCALEPSYAKEFTANGAAYIAKITALDNRLQQVREKLVGRRCVIFHDSLAYLAEDLGLVVEESLSVGEESGVSAAELTAVQRLAGQYPDLLLLYDNQYPLHYAAVDNLVPAGQVLALDSAVSGTGDPQDWLTAMEKNAALFERLAEG